MTSKRALGYIYKGSFTSKNNTSEEFHIHTAVFLKMYLFTQIHQYNQKQSSSPQSGF